MHLHTSGPEGRYDGLTSLFDDPGGLTAEAYFDTEAAHEAYLQAGGTDVERYWDAYIDSLDYDLVPHDNPY